MQFLADKDKIYVSVEYREGTGHFYAGSHYVSALPGKKNSMKLLDQEAQKAREAADKAAAKSAGKSGQEEDPETLKMYLDKAGRIAFAPHLLGEMDVRYEDGAFDLVLYDRAGILTEQDAVTVRKAWLPEFEYADEKDISCNPQIMEYVGGRAFTVYTESMRDPENDIGWRYAYKLSRTVYELCEPEKDAEQIAAVEAARFLTPEEVTAFNKELDPDLCGFFLSDYRNPTEINWSEVLYNGAGISVQPGKKELDAYLEASGMDELYTDVTAIRGKDLNSFVFKTTGTPYKNALRPLILSWTYLPKYDLYLHMAGDTNHQQIEFSNGWDLGDHTYRLRYTVNAPDREHESWPYEATVRVENGQWTFLSNLPE